MSERERWPCLCCEEASIRARYSNKRANIHPTRINNNTSCMSLFAEMQIIRQRQHQDSASFEKELCICTSSWVSDLESFVASQESFMESIHCIWSFNLEFQTMHVISVSMTTLVLSLSDKDLQQLSRKWWKNYKLDVLRTMVIPLLSMKFVRSRSSESIDNYKQRPHRFVQTSGTQRLRHDPSPFLYWMSTVY